MLAHFSISYEDRGKDPLDASETFFDDDGP